MPALLDLVLAVFHWDLADEAVVGRTAFCPFELLLVPIGGLVARRPGPPAGWWTTRKAPWTPGNVDWSDDTAHLVDWAGRFDAVATAPRSS